MKRFLLITLLALLAAACNYVDPSLTQQTRVYSDKGPDLSDLVIYVQPRARREEPLRALCYPFWIQQEAREPAFLGQQFARIFHRTWVQEQLFPALLYDDELSYRGKERAIATARRRGADLVVVGTVPYFYAGSTLDDSAITIRIDIYETQAGRLIASMEQSGRVEKPTSEDYIYFVHQERISDAPLAQVIQAIARDMAVPLRSWLPRSDLGFAASEEQIVQGLTTARPYQGQQAPAPAASAAQPAPTQADLAPESIAQGGSVNLSIEFDVDKATIRPESYPLLEQLGLALTSPALRGKRVVIAGHTDSDASEEYNQNLSERRAQAVKDWLVRTYQIPEADLVVMGYGESRPLMPNDTPENKQINRRVEVRLADS